MCRSPRRSRELDELRQRAVARRLELAAVLAQLRRDPRVAEERVDLLLGRERVHLAGLDLGDPVLGDREAAPHGRLAQRDVVVLRAGEVLEQVAVRTPAARRGGRSAGRRARRRSPSSRPSPPPRRPTGTSRTRRAAHGASVAVAIRSRSRTVSRQRRAEPAIETRTAAGCAATSAATARSFGSARPSSARCGSSTAFGFASAARILSSSFGPRPLTVRSSCASAAARSAATVVIPSSCQSRRAVFGPRPGSRMNVATSGGTSVLRFVSAWISPSSTAWTIFSSIVLPIPWSSFARPSSASCATELDVSRIRAGRLAVGADAEAVAALELHQVGEQVELRCEIGVPRQRPAHAPMIRGRLFRNTPLRPMRATICLPTYNERENLEPMVQRARRGAPRRRPRARDRRRVARRDGRARRPARRRAAVRRRAPPHEQGGARAGLPRRLPARARRRRRARARDGLRLLPRPERRAAPDRRGRGRRRPRARLALRAAAARSRTGVSRGGPSRRGGNLYAQVVPPEPHPRPDRRLQVLPPARAGVDPARRDRLEGLRLPDRDDLPRARAPASAWKRCRSPSPTASRASRR